LREEIDISVVIEGNVKYRNSEEKLTLHYLKARGLNLLTGKGQDIEGFSLALVLFTYTDVDLHFVSSNERNDLNSLWGNSPNERYYLIEGLKTMPLDAFELPDLNFSTSKLFESRLGMIYEAINSNSIAHMMIQNMSDKQSFLDQIKGKIFSVRYIDKYNRSELSLRLMLQFIEEFKKEAEINVDKFVVLLNNIDFQNGSYPSRIFDNYYEVKDYEYDLNHISEDLAFSVSLECVEKHLPHYRLFEFSSVDMQFNIRIDGGIAHGFKVLDSSMELRMKNEIFQIRKYVNHDIIYNLRIL